jgi:hypothetical protein
VFCVTCDATLQYCHLAYDIYCVGVVCVMLLDVQCLCMALLTVAQRPMLTQYPSMTLTAWYYAVGSMFTLLACIFGDLSANDLLLTSKLQVRWR